VKANINVDSLFEGDFRMPIPVDECLQLMILAPQGAGVSPSAVNLIRDKTMHASLLGEMQRFRGRVALREGAITASMLDSSGGHRMQGDEKSWHLLRVRNDGKIAGCARILVHPRDVTFSRLRIASSRAARCPVWARDVHDAVESELTRARLNGLAIIEPGGWVIDEDLRGSCEAVSIAIGAFAWAQILDDCIGFLTATAKHGSATILRRLGARNLQAHGQTIPGYFEPAWGCNAELLRFDTNSLNPRFEAALVSARGQLSTSPVFSAESVPPRNEQFFPNSTDPQICRPTFTFN
jgi:hypothetical protein